MEGVRLQMVLRISMPVLVMGPDSDRCPGRLSGAAQVSPETGIRKVFNKSINDVGNCSGFYIRCQGPSICKIFSANSGLGFRV